MADVVNPIAAGMNKAVGRYMMREPVPRPKSEAWELGDTVGLRGTVSC